MAKSSTTGMFRVPGTGMYAIPTQTSAKFPEEYLERTLGQLKLGENVVVDAAALVVDNDRDCWLRPDFICKSDAAALNSATPCLSVTRDERGYVVSLHGSKGHRWRLGPKPEPTDGVAWIPVVELKY